MWLVVILFLILFALPVGYGWGYRGWGPPYPSYYRRRRPAVEGPYEETSGWGVLADVLAGIFVVFIFWFVAVALF